MNTLRNLLLAISSLFLAFPSLAEAERPLSWTPLSEDLDILRIPASNSTFVQNELVVVRTTLKKYRVEVLRTGNGARSSALALAKSRRAIVAINGNFFSPQGAPLGAVVSRGELINPVQLGGTLLTGIFQANRQGVTIQSRTSFDPHRALEAIQAGPRLLIAGQPVAGFSQRAERAARAGVCIDKHGSLTLFCTASDILGVSFFELQSLLRDPLIDCEDALSFDGGSSAQMAISAGTSKEILVGSSLPIPVVLALVER